MEPAAENKEAQPTGIMQLPPKIVSKIMSYLDHRDRLSLSYASSEWKNVIRQPNFWKNVTISVELNKSLGPVFQATIMARSIDRVRFLNGTGHQHKLDKLDMNNAVSYMRRRGDPSYVPPPELALCRAFDLPLSTEDGPMIQQVEIIHTDPQIPHLLVLWVGDSRLLIDPSFARTNKLLQDFSGIYVVGCDNIASATIKVFQEFPDIPPKRMRVLLRHSGLTREERPMQSDEERRCLSAIHCWPTNIMTGTVLHHLSFVGDVKELYLHGNYCNVHDRWLPHLLAGTWEISTLELADCDVTALGMSILARVTTLVALGIVYCFGVDDLGISKLTTPVSNIKILHICGSHITDSAMDHFCKFPHLQQLSLIDCPRLTKAGINILADSDCHLVLFTMHRCPKVDSSALRLISSGLFELVYLSLDSDHVDDDGLALAARTLKDLSSLTCNGNQLFGEIRRLRKLQDAQI